MKYFLVSSRSSLCVSSYLIGEFGFLVWWHEFVRSMKSNGNLTCWWLVNCRPLRNTPTWHCMAFGYLTLTPSIPYSIYPILSTPLASQPWLILSMHSWLCQCLISLTSAPVCLSCHLTLLLPHSFHLPPSASLPLLPQLWWYLSSHGLFWQLCKRGRSSHLVQWPS